MQLNAFWYLVKVVSLLLLISGLIFLFFRVDELRFQLDNIYSNFFDEFSQVDVTFNPIARLEEITEREVNAPEPLVGREDSPQANLTIEGVIRYTNAQREANGMPPLRQNSTLNNSAAIKAADMFAQQYFAHDSPDGVGAGDLADRFGYAFIAIGENLAMGNYRNDEVLVQAWMDSPGHRENIVSSKYTEIGVAVLRGTYEGRSIWMAVQHFGRPLSDCPRPDNTLQQQIDSENSSLKDLQRDIERRRDELEKSDQSDPEAYNKKVDEYNKLVEQHNSLINEIENLVDRYNTQVSNFNKCVG